jgi:hypothetical protein
MHQKAKGLYNTPSVQAIFWQFVLLAIVSREKLHINYMIFGNLDIKFDGDKKCNFIKCKITLVSAHLDILLIS